MCIRDRDDSVSQTAVTIDQSIMDTQCSSDYTGSGNDGSYNSCYEKYSERAVITVEASTAAVTLADDDQIRFIYDGTTVNDLKDLISGANGTSAYSYINYDFRAFNGGKNDNNYYLNFTVGDSTIGSFAGNQGTSYANALDEFFNTGLVGSALINSPGSKATGFGSLTGTDDLRVTVELNAIDTSSALDTISTGTSYPITMDFLSLIHI